MKISFSSIQYSQPYERKFLAKLWGYQDFHAIAKGVVTPINTNYIILFVTKEKQGFFPQYNDFIDGDLLYWEGEEKHSSDLRVINSIRNLDEIHLFYRDIHHTPFVYFGKITLLDFFKKEIEPSEFIFRIESLSSEMDVFTEVREHSSEYKTLNITEQEQIIVSRVGQGDFRKNVIRLWGSCSLSGLQNISLLRASHIKPWKDCDNQERLSPFNGLLLTPDYDLLFDKGYIAFNDDGKILVSHRLDGYARRVFDVEEKLHLRKTFKESREYFDYHRTLVFK